VTIVAGRALVILAALLGRVACQSEKTIEPQAVEDSIRKGLEREDWPVEKVECPRGVRIQAQDTFHCSVLVGLDEPIDVTVTQKDDLGHVTWTTPHVLLPSKIEKRLAQLRSATDVHCGEKLVVPKQGNRVSCTAVVAGKPSRIEVTFTDDEGAYTTSVAPR